MRRAWLLVLVALVCAASPGLGSTFLLLSPQELVAEAESVVEGEVIEAQSYWNAEHTAILTDAVLRVHDTVIGTAEPFVNLRTFGGRVGDYMVVAHGFPTFEVGERLLLFLAPEKDGVHRVAGYLQGQYRVRTDARGERLAVPTLDLGSRYLTKDGGTAPAPRTRPLAEVKAQLRELAAREGRPAVR